MRTQRLITQADVLHAVEWRLSAWPTDQVESLMDRICLFIGRPLAENDTDVARLIVEFPKEKRSRWTAFCALLALAAHRLGDVATLMSAGHVVFEAYRNSSFRTNAPRKQHTLAAPLREYLSNNPHARSGEIFETWAGVAGVIEPFADYDPDSETLTYADASGRLIDVSRRSFSIIASRLRGGEIEAALVHRQDAGTQSSTLLDKPSFAVQLS